MEKLEKELRAREKEEKAAGEALGKAHAARKAAQGKVRKANEDFQRIRSMVREGADTESYAFRKKIRAAEEEHEAAKKADEAAAKELNAASKAFDAARDETIRVKGQLSAPTLKALEEKVSVHLAKVREFQAAAEAELKALAGLYVEAESSVPRRVVWKRALKKELLVRPIDLSMREVAAKSIRIPNVEPGCFYMEFFAAMKRTGEGGKLEFPPDILQDFSVPDESDREQVEVQWEPGRLPEVFETIAKLDLGIPIPENGASPPAQSGRKRVSWSSHRRLDFRTVVNEIQTERQGQQATGRRA